MKSRYHRFVRRLLIAMPLVILVAWLVPPFFSAERYRRRLEAGLQQALRRPVTFGAVSFRLLWRPGFTIHNAVVREDPAFGSEPFARVDNIDCALRWRSLLLSRVDCAHLSLDRPTFNVVHNVRGKWNVEDLLRKSGVALPMVSGRSPRRASGLDLDAEDGRINFKVGDDKKPFAITELKGRLYFDPGQGLIRYSLAGRPVRTDLSWTTPGGLAAPGTLELTGEWAPGSNLEGPLQASLRTGKSLLYDWIPLLTGRNPGLYGVLDATASITGSFQDLSIEGDCQISQLHRWELPPPSDSMPFQLHYRGQFNRRLGRVRVEEISGSFADSAFRVAGSLASLPGSPRLDLALSVHESHLEDLVALGRRFWGESSEIGLYGRVDGRLTVQGPWAARRYGGLFIAREVRVRAPVETVPVSEIALRIDSRGAQLSPVRIALAPGVETVLEGALYGAAPSSGRTPAAPAQRTAQKSVQATKRARTNRRAGSTLAASPAALRPENNLLPRYELSFSGKGVPLTALLRLARGRSASSLQDLEIEQGTASGILRLTGRAWPPSPPQIESHVDIERASLLLPGLNEPLRLSRVHVESSGSRILASPLTAEVGDSLFAGRLEHAGDMRQPWKFSLHASKLSLEQASQWFEALGRPPSASLLDRLPGFGSFTRRRTAALNLFRALKAEGTLAASTVTYRALTLADFRAGVVVSGRVVRVSGATFRSAGGRGEGHAAVDMTSYPARVEGEVSLDKSNLQALAHRLPPALKGLRGLVSGSARFETTGLNHQEMSTNLQALASLRLRDVSFGEFDPLDALTRRGHCGRLQVLRKEAALQDATWTLQARDRRVFLVLAPAEITGAMLQLTGSYGFDGTVDVGIHCDFSHVARRWQKNESLAAAVLAPSQTIGDQENGTPLQVGARANSSPSLADLHLSGPLDKLTVMPALEISHTTR
jgi:hypothetical protein